jgi:hypothetical protein
MISRMTHQVLAMSLSAVLLVQGVAAQTNPQSSSTVAAPTVAPLTTDQLDSLVAPIALYPDAMQTRLPSPMTGWGRIRICRVPH